jgi:hypothetical protein
MGGACSTYGERSDACRVLLGIADRKRPSELGGVGRVLITWYFRK